MDDTFQPFREGNYPNGCIFQQDGPPCHTAKYTRDYCIEEEMTDMSWPPKSPDMNPVENAWGYLVQKLYAESRQSDTIEDLKEAVFFEWDKLDIS